MIPNRLSQARHFLQTLWRWIRSRAERRYEWQLSATYWRVRQRFLTVNFWLDRSLFAGKEKLRQSWTSGSIIREILQTIVGQVALAILLVFGIWLVDIGLKRLGIPTQKLVFVVDPDAFVELSATLAQVAGAFLGLYFAAVSVVASTVYARVPGDVRSVLMQEKVGTVYIRMVALLGAVTVLLLGLHAAGYGPIGLHLLLVTALGVIAVLSFVILGTRAFNFFDPTTLAAYVVQDLIRTIRLATPDGVAWRNPSFQAHYQRLAERALDTYDNIVTLAVSEAHLRGRAIVALFAQLFSVLQFYAKNKARIITDSRWFKQQQRHRDWFTTDYTQVALALQTGTSLQPEAIPDPMWFEQEIEEILASAVRRLVDLRDFGTLSAICDAEQKTLGVLREHLAVDEALRLFRAIRGEVHQITSIRESSAQTLEPLQLRIAVVDTHAMGLISLLLGVARRLSSLTADRFGVLIDSLAWRNPRSIYSIEMPRAVVQQLEYLAKGLEFEHRVEGRSESPGWYRRQIAALAFARFLWEAAGRLVDELDATVVREADRLIATEQYLVAAQLIQRGLETVEKFRAHLRRIEEVVEGLHQFRQISDIPWPSTEWTELRNRVARMRDQMVHSVARLANHLAPLPVSELLPDYFGHAYAVLAQESYEAMANGDEEVFQQLFPSFFLSGLAAHDRLRQQLREHDQERALIYATEPLADLLELSGYAIIYSELDRRTFWGTTRRLWDAYFEGMLDRTAATQFIHAVIEYRRSFFAILPRDIARTSWKQRLEHRLRRAGLMQDMFESRHVTRERAQHPSATIRALGRGHFLFEEPTDVFMVVYLGQRPEAAGLEFGRRAESFLQTLQREVSADSNEDRIEDLEL